MFKAAIFLNLKDSARKVVVQPKLSPERKSLPSVFLTPEYRYLQYGKDRTMAALKLDAIFHLLLRNIAPQAITIMAARTPLRTSDSRNEFYNIVKLNSEL